MSEELDPRHDPMAGLAATQLDETRALAERFIRALRDLEERQELEPLVRLHGDECDIRNAAAPHTFRGQDGAREFWTSYRSAFQEMRSDVRNVVVDDRRAALEWETTGTSSAGHPIRYGGVSVLEFDGDRLSRFRAYFDPADLGHQMVQ